MSEEKNNVCELNTRAFVVYSFPIYNFISSPDFYGRILYATEEKNNVYFYFCCPVVAIVIDSIYKRCNSIAFYIYIPYHAMSFHCICRVGHSYTIYFYLIHDFLFTFQINNRIALYEIHTHNRSLLTAKMNAKKKANEGSNS